MNPVRDRGRSGSKFFLLKNITDIIKHYLAGIGEDRDLSLTG